MSEWRREEQLNTSCSCSSRGKPKPSRNTSSDTSQGEERRKVELILFSSLSFLVFLSLCCCSRVPLPLRPPLHVRLLCTHYIGDHSHTRRRRHTSHLYYSTHARAHNSCPPPVLSFIVSLRQPLLSSNGDEKEGIATAAATTQANSNYDTFQTATPLNNNNTSMSETPVIVIAEQKPAGQV